MWVRGLKPITEHHPSNNEASHPVWVRGLKHNLQHPIYAFYIVAPRVGAWIETLDLDKIVSGMGGSHPVWVRGLKHVIQVEEMIRQGLSHPVWVRGLKHGGTPKKQREASRTPCGCVD